MPGIGHLQWKYIAEANISPHGEFLPLVSSTWLLVARNTRSTNTQTPVHEQVPGHTGSGSEEVQLAGKTDTAR